MDEATRDAIRRYREGRLPHTIGEEMIEPDDDRDDSDWTECDECGGEGGHHGCGEDTCVCADPEDMASDDWQPCSTCDGEGGWPVPHGWDLTWSWVPMEDEDNHPHGLTVWVGEVAVGASTAGCAEWFGCPHLPALAEVNPDDPRRLPDGSAYAAALMLAEVARHLGATHG